MVASQWCSEAVWWAALLRDGWRTLAMAALRRQALVIMEQSAHANHLAVSTLQFRWSMGRGAAVGPSFNALLHSPLRCDGTIVLLALHLP
jgi:hypothetical protein